MTDTNSLTFDFFLYGGIRDLDKQIGNLIHKIYVSDLLLTKWSCSGHAEKVLLDSETFASNGNLACSPGLLFYQLTDTPKSLEKHNEITQILSKYSFSKTNNWEEGVYNHYLGFSDLSLSVNEGSNSDVDLCSICQLPIEKAEKRMSKIYSIWKELEDCF